ncbi:glycosyltransferase family 4 protein [Rhodopseudomonas palustris]|uniref:glycosyltransferase family 4 protein n=1 Tax=Rhodopseudomonas palustris TaxID=1076 RepID=UPI0020CC1696|nr:glycosyltransferase family 4 protein [Rhodopseudomonas palustris]
MRHADLPDVVVVNDRAFPGGGASKVALQSAVGLARRGHRVTVFAAMGPATPDLTDAGIDLHLLGQSDLASGERLRMAAQGLWNSKAAEQLGSVLEGTRRGRTIVHIHSWSKALSASVFAAAGRSGHAVIATLHDYGFVCPNAALHDFPTGTACSRTPMSLGCLAADCDARARAHKLWRVARQISLSHVAGASRLLAAAVCVTDYSRRIMQPFVSDRLAMVVVPNPIDVADLGPAAPARSGHFTYVGRFSREKGVLIAAEAAQRAGVPLVLVGDGELRNEVARIAPSATITGWLPAEKVGEAIRASRAVVVPSLWRETQGMVVPEALSAGVPVIAATATAPAAAIEPGVTGLLFENGDAGALAHLFSRLAANDRLVADLGEAAYRNYWQTPATMDRHLDGLEALYERVLSERSKTHRSEARSA